MLAAPRLRHTKIVVNLGQGNTCSQCSKRGSLELAEIKAHNPSRIALAPPKDGRRNFRQRRAAARTAWPQNRPGRVPSALRNKTGLMATPREILDLVRAEFAIARAYSFSSESGGWAKRPQQSYPAGASADHSSAANPMPVTFECR